MAYIKGCALVDRDHQFKSCASPKPLELAPLCDFPTTPRQRLGRLKGISVTLFLTGKSSHTAVCSDLLKKSERASLELCG